MLFKQLKVFRFECEALDIEAAEQACQQYQLQNCPKSQYHSVGWQSPFGKGSEVMIHATQGYWLMSLAKQERLLPASVIKEHLDERIEQIRQKQERNVYAKEKQSLKEEIEFQLLPQAFTRNQSYTLYLDIKQKWLYVGVTNTTVCQQLLELLNKTFGGFKADLVETELTISNEMTRWLHDNRWPKGFVIERDCEMFDQEHEKNIVRFSQQNLAAKEVIAHLDHGKKLSKLSLSWQDRISFTVDTNLSVSKIKFLDIIEEQRKDAFCDTKEQQLDADFTITCLEFANWFPALLELFGGEKTYDESPSTEVDNELVTA
ncbi:MAG: recombination-associated protein RdgC [Coxiellaceae bacterium]|nr:recombination-associated protein RdgC [Coxiellaceae bacterium]